MLEKALNDTHGKLQNTVEKLENNEYLPKLGEHFELVSDIETKVGNVSIYSVGYKVLKSYSLHKKWRL